MTRTEIKPGQGVAVFALPIPASAITFITDCVERVYGTGDAMMEFKGDSIQINAPADGFGPRRKGGKRPPRPQDDEMRLVHQDFVDGKVTLTLEDMQERILVLSAILGQYFELLGATNYVEMQLRSPDADIPFVLTLQQTDGLTPHAARQLAEARLRAVQNYLAQTAENIDEAHHWTAADQRECITTALDIIESAPEEQAR